MRVNAEHRVEQGRGAMHCSTLQHTAATAAHFDTPQHPATARVTPHNTPQHTATESTTTPRGSRLTPRMQASLGIQIRADAHGWPVVEGFDPTHTPSNTPSENLEIGWRILWVDCQHTQFVPVSEVQKWLLGPLGSLVMICLAIPPPLHLARDTGGAGGEGGREGGGGNLKEWEVVLVRTCVADAEMATPRQSKARHYYLVSLRRMWRPEDHNIQKPVGIGVTFEGDAHQRFRVASLLPGGSADLSGQVGVGDLLFSVNGLQVTGRPTESVIQLIKGAPGTRIALVLVSEAPSSARSHPGKDAFRYDAFSVVPHLGHEPGEIVAVIVGAQGLLSPAHNPAVFCQVRLVDVSGEGLLREELVGVDKAGLSLGVRVMKSRFLIERDTAACEDGGLEGVLGTVYDFDTVRSAAGTCTVLWDNGELREHAVGLNDEYDLEIAPQMTTISKNLGDTRWDNVVTLRVRDPTFAALEITIWERENYLGEVLVKVDNLVHDEGLFEEQSLPVCHDEEPSSGGAYLLMACAWFSSQNRNLTRMSKSI